MDIETLRDEFDAECARIAARRATEALDALATRLASRGLAIEATTWVDDETGEIVLSVNKPGSSVFDEERIGAASSAIEFVRACEELGDRILAGVRTAKRKRSVRRKAAPAE